MTSTTRPRRTAVILLIAVVAAMLAAVTAGVLRPWAAPVAPQAAAAQPVVLPAPIHLPENPRVLVIGDSWTYGSAATPVEQGYAYRLAELLGGETVVNGNRGSGYIREDRIRFGEVIAALDPAAAYDLIVMQGSINDRFTPLDGYDAAVNAAWDRLAATYPGVPVVVLGPAPQVLPVEKATARIDKHLASLAAHRGWWYISPLQEKWITEENYLSVIDTSDFGRDHPSVEGHAYLAQHVADALAEITDPVTSVEASEDHPTG